ncbi:hypothetical protein MLD38_026292 [Melastoma candidum]|uniref:Uncharacterized protein n=1 Tax=Melastoma candidum TaxID=119954 RepID=A0ACB9NZH1_9MYRT|nr:hypothetical protein MLD38_026292 [Melastoma candidum]
MKGMRGVQLFRKPVRVLLKGLGEDVNREGLRKTPLRVAKAFREGTRGYRQKVRDILQGALFPEAGLAKGIGHGGGVGGLGVVRDLDLFSYCESCLLPFQIHGVWPMKVCSALQNGIRPAGMAIVLQCSHLHFPNVENAPLDANHQEWVKVEVSSGSGVFEDENSDAWVDFLSLLKFRLGKIEKNCPRNGVTGLMVSISIHFLLERFNCCIGRL